MFTGEALRSAGIIPTKACCLRPSLFRTDPGDGANMARGSHNTVNHDNHRIKIGNFEYQIQMPVGLDHKLKRLNTIPATKFQNHATCL